MKWRKLFIFSYQLWWLSHSMDCNQWTIVWQDYFVWQEHRCTPFILLDTLGIDLDRERPEHFLGAAIWFDQQLLSPAGRPPWLVPQLSHNAGYMGDILRQRRTMGREKSEGKDQLIFQSTTSCRKNGGSSILAWTSMADSEMGLLTMWLPTRIRMNSEVKTAVPFAHIQSNATKRMGLRFAMQMDNDHKLNVKSSHGLSEAN